MAASGRTARRLLQFWKPGDAPTISAWSEALAGQLDNDVEGGQGTLAARPAAALRGRIWVVQGDATAANNGVVWWDTGSTWIAIGATPLPPVTRTGSFTAQVGEAIIINPTAGSIALPNASGLIEIFNFTSGDVTITAFAGGGGIKGDFLGTGATMTIKLSVGQHLRLLLEGTQAYVIAGEPKREQTYAAKTFTKAEAEAGVEPSATRPATVAVAGLTEAEFVTVGGATAGMFTITASATVFVPPGAKWKTKTSVTAWTILL
jgi:hypothetical protein